ncbi:MAG: hypothetical protein A4S17_09790 [Proteobacteria bacterium HN_bin10]|nr:MAG: hypothetical protein A4S17_09790 [Proteobacteria bacterium HN_bin10]
MTKSLTIQIDAAAAEKLARIANDLGETPEAFAAKAVAASVESFESNVFFARRAKGLDRAAALAWLRELASRQDGPAPDPDDRLPEGYSSSR